jgi:hypothetical protein
MLNALPSMKTAQDGKKKSFLFEVGEQLTDGKAFSIVLFFCACIYLLGHKGVSAAVLCLLVKAPGFPWSPTEAIHGGVVHKVPNENSNDAVLALVDLRGLNDFLLERCWKVPVNHAPRALLNWLSQKMAPSTYS